MSEEYKYNLLTQELLLQGYTTENHPDYVRIGIGKMGKSPLKIRMVDLFIPTSIWKRKLLCPAVGCM